ncbi:MAG TPA: cysteine--tRNA ligase [Candidatus Saccharimonadales bacterium]|nr:cysteine--tRNA ligase [Candidatus Saccharimonadales bacterium]
MALKLYNTLSRTVEVFEPLDGPNVSMYSCGPTVYDYQHIGHMRRYVGDDILIRALQMNHYRVKHVMNITDVGHLTSDSDTGQDKMEKGAAKFGLSVWDIAKKFEKQFFNSMDALNIKTPNIIVHATDCIDDQIELIKILEEKGFTYKIADGIYFDTSKFPDYNKLSHQDLSALKEGARVAAVAGKRNPTDFALWKFSPKGLKREMEWKSPWGVGFPGWHIECSTMAMKNLGVTIDIHTGGIDHINIHHTNEIAQSEGASGKQFVRFWVHHNFLLFDAEKMSKSLGNIYTVQDIKKEGFSPLSLRYLYLQTHYRQEMNFTWESLAAAQTALKSLWEKAQVFSNPGLEITVREPSKKAIKIWEDFVDEVDNDLNTAGALAVLHSGLKLAEDDYDIAFLLKSADEVLGLGLVERGKSLFEEQEKMFSNPSPSQIEVLELLQQRNDMRKQKKFAQADQIRHKIKKLGYDVLDQKGGKTELKKL